MKQVEWGFRFSSFIYDYKNKTVYNVWSLFIDSAILVSHKNLKLDRTLSILFVNWITYILIEITELHIIHITMIM